jgi:serine protease AprX
MARLRLSSPRVIATAIVLAVSLLPTAAFPAAPQPMTVVVVGESTSSEAARAVRSLGGTVRHRVDLIDAVVARIDSASFASLSADPRVDIVVRDYKIRMQGASYGGALQSTYPDSINATDLWATGLTGRGVGVALLDTGVYDHADLQGRVIASADLTSEGSFSDEYGHGTFMAGIVAGNGATSGGRYVGVAPEANLMSVKVAGGDGVTTLGQVLYGLQLIDASRHRYNIRVVLLAIAGPATSGPDPLVLAVERLWADGLVVVTAAGNSGPGPSSIGSPAVDPYVITVGATDESGSAATEDDTVPSWSARGPSVFGLQKPDFVAPGSSVVSLQSPGSTLDSAYPGARIDTGYFRGSGTSMSAAVTAGAAALMLQANPRLTPDVVKGRLLAGAGPIGSVDAHSSGAGALDVAAAVSSSAGPANVDLPPLPIGGRVEPPHDPVPGKGRNRRSWDWYRSPVGGDRWLGRDWAAKAWNGTEWVGRGWAGRGWAGADWSGRGWADSSWAGRGWAGRGWAGELWSGQDWAGRGWAGRGWAAWEWN